VCLSRLGGGIVRGVWGGWADGGSDGVHLEAIIFILLVFGIPDLL
jgi:hypothetical protein